MSLLSGGCVDRGCVRTVGSSAVGGNPCCVLTPNITVPRTQPRYKTLGAKVSLALLRRNICFPKGSRPVGLLVKLSTTSTSSRVNTVRTLDRLLYRRRVLRRLLATSSRGRLTSVVDHKWLLSPLRSGVVRGGSTHTGIRTFKNFLATVIVPGVNTFVT